VNIELILLEKAFYHGDTDTRGESQYFLGFVSLSLSLSLSLSFSVIPWLKLSCPIIGYGHPA